MACKGMQGSQTGRLSGRTTDTHQMISDRPSVWFVINEPTTSPSSHTVHGRYTYAEMRACAECVCVCVCRTFSSAHIVLLVSDVSSTTVSAIASTTNAHSLVAILDT